MDLVEIILGGVVGGTAASLLNDYFKKHGGVSGVVAELEKTGLGQQVKSWVSTEPNLPISSKEMEEAVGAEHVKQMAAESGMPYDKVLDLLAKHVPTIIDKATLEGKVSEQGVDLSDYARQLFEAHGDKAVVEAAQKARALEEQGKGEDAKSWRRIEAILKERLGAHES